MPLRSPKMYSFILGFQRLVWWPKWTPASSSSFIVMLAMVKLLFIDPVGIGSLDLSPAGEIEFLAPDR